MTERNREPNGADADIVALVQQYLDGELTPEQASLLSDRLRLDARARTLFVRSLMQAAHLHELLAQQRSADAAPILGGATVPTEAGDCPSASGASPPTPAPIETPTGDDSSPSGLGVTQMWSCLTGWNGVGLIALAVIVASGVLLFGRREDAKLADQSSLSPAAVAVTSQAAPTEVFDPRSIRLDAGSARVTLPKVGYMLVDGPADVELIAPLRARLNRGRIRVRVTEESGRGFVVETPDGEVVDLSTEFGLEVAENKYSGVVVFAGAVDLRLAGSAAGSEPRVERLTGGEGATFNKLGELGRVVSITTGKVATFLSQNEASVNSQKAVIVKVADNLRSDDTKKFYEIVPGGLGEDVLAYVDRPEHEWNGLSKAGIPKFLVGADYVKTFSDDKTRSDTVIRVWLSRPATLYVFYDGKLKPPEWLTSEFRRTGDRVGMDLGPWPTINRPVQRAVGPGERIDHWFTVWKRVVRKPGVVQLGGNGTHDTKGRPSDFPYMYGIAAVALDADEAHGQEDAKVSKEQ
ncbi:MAG TPA: hypothetical protein DD670_04090 [Planctomycetaceae bacterium]|nr:hypothetical protein [Planctomycetaceae bacterium]